MEHDQQATWLLDVIGHAWLDGEHDRTQMGDPRRMETIAARWGTLTREVVTQMLQQGNRHERVFAIQAFTAFTSAEEARSGLLPWLHSSDVRLRWASALALGTIKEPQAFATLQGLLEEDLLAFSVQNRDAVWCQFQRPRLARLLGAWGDSAATPALTSAFARCWEFETRTRPDLRLEDRRHWNAWVHPFAESLAYALGQLEAWGALARVPLPPAHFQMALLYLILGALHFHDPRIFGSAGGMSQLFTTPDPHEDEDDPEGFFTPPRCEATPVLRLLRERFGFSHAEQHDFLAQWPEVERRRADEDGPLSDEMS